MPSKTRDCFSVNPEREELRERDLLNYFAKFFAKIKNAGYLVSAYKYNRGKNNKENNVNRSWNIINIGKMRNQKRPRSQKEKESEKLKHPESEFSIRKTNITKSVKSKFRQF